MATKRIILAAKSEGLRYSDMDAYETDQASTVAKISELRTKGYRIFFVMDTAYIVDDFA